MLDLRVSPPLPLHLAHPRALWTSPVSRRWPSWWAGFPWAKKRSPRQRLAVEILSFVGAIVAIVMLVRVIWQLIIAPNQYPLTHPLGEVEMVQEEFSERCGEARARPTVITVAYAPSLAEWVEPAATLYMRDCPNSQLRLLSMDDLAAIKAMIAGELAPTLWIPHDGALLAMLEERALARRGREPAEGAGIDLEAAESGPSLLRSPMVVLMWEDRLEALDAALPAGVHGPGVWTGSVCAGVPVTPDQPALGEREAADDRARGAMGPATWAEVTGTPSLAPWGRVRVDHASPSASTVGLLGLSLVARDYRWGQGAGASLGTPLGAPGGAFQGWLRRCEADRPEPKATGRLLTETMFNLGDPALSPLGSDGVITTEQLAFSVLTRVDAHERGVEAVRLVYPDDTASLDHPGIYFAGASSEGGKVARRFVASLLGEEQQIKALELGFRPTNPAVDLRSHDTGPNPFMRLRRHGVALELSVGAALEVEGGELSALRARWQDATGRQ